MRFIATAAALASQRWQVAAATQGQAAGRADACECRCESLVIHPKFTVAARYELPASTRGSDLRLCRSDAVAAMLPDKAPDIVTFVDPN